VGQTYVDSFAVSWVTPNGSTLDAVSPITMTITDPTIVTGDTVYLYDSSGTSAAGTATHDGTVTVSFSSDPIYLVASSKTPQETLRITTVNGHVGVALKLATTGGSGTGVVNYVVANGTASGCTVSGSELTAKSAGTCEVTATKAADSNYDATSSTATSVIMSRLAIPAPVSVVFAKGQSTLSAIARRSLVALSARLNAGAQLSVTGYAHDNAKLARNRADIVIAFVTKRIQVAAVIKIITSSTFNKAMVVTKQQ
jgi:hypothetical protein